MKYILSLLLCSVFLVLALVNTKKTPEVARIHVIANSDSQEDIALKMKVSKAVTKALENERFDSTLSIKTALEESLDDIVDLSKEIVTSENFSYEVKGEVGVKHFDKKTLSGSALPEGDYLSLIITLGNGEGRNWWSVIFPDIALGASLAQGEEGRGGKTVLLGNIGVVKIRSLLLDIFRY